MSNFHLFRLSGVFPCSVDRLTFPLDTHVCPIKLKSCKYVVLRLGLYTRVMPLVPGRVAQSVARLTQEPEVA